MNRFRTVRYDTPSAPLRAAMGLVRWSIMRSFHKENRVSFRASCFITGRARGTTQRFSVARTRVKQFSSEGRLFGVRKSSW